MTKKRSADNLTGEKMVTKNYPQKPFFEGMSIMHQIVAFPHSNCGKVCGKTVFYRYYIIIIKKNYA
jgi:hypothetical protein